LTGVEIIKLLKKNGYKHLKIVDGHYHFRNISGTTFQVPHHHKEMGKGLAIKILKYAGLTG